MDSINITANEANQRLDRFLRKYLKHMSLSDIYKLLRTKRVTVNGKKSREDYRLLEGDIVDILVEGPVQKNEAVKKASRDFTAIYEDSNLMIVDKPPGLILHPDAGHHEDTLVDQVLYYLQEKGEYSPEKSATFRPASINRLDINTGGIVIFAKNYNSLQTLNEMMRQRSIEKYYICIVKGRVDSEREIQAYLVKDHGSNIVRISNTYEENSKPIHTRLIPLRYLNGYTLMEINLITGRSHQIRAQASNIGHPIIGDMKYGADEDNRYFRKAFGLRNQFLYGYRISFTDALGEMSYLKGKSFKAILPPDYRSIIEKMFNFKVE